MKLDVILDYKRPQPHLEGVQELPSGYTIRIERSDGQGMVLAEALTAMQTCINSFSREEVLKGIPSE